MMPAWHARPSSRLLLVWRPCGFAQPAAIQQSKEKKLRDDFPTKKQSLGSVDNFLEHDRGKKVKKKFFFKQ